jgi:hypothetical protein
MANSPTPWLEETITEQLQLGRDWLELKNDVKQSEPRAEPGRAWAGLYHDNGSCLDITNEFEEYSDSNKCLKIIKAREFA